MKRPLLSLLTALTLLLPSALFAADKTYPIKFERPSAVGQKYAVSILFSEFETTKITLNGSDNTENKAPKAELVGITQVTAVNKRGDEIATTITLEKFVLLDGDKSESLLDKGAVLTMKVTDNKPVFTLKDGQLPDQAQEILTSMYHSDYSEDRNGDDAVMGTKEPQKVGDSWPMNAALAVKDFEKNGLKIDPNDFTGSAHLLAVLNVSDVPCLQFHNSIDIKSLQMNPNANLPPGLTLDHGSLKATIHGYQPADPSLLLPTKYKVTMTLDLTLKGQVADTNFHSQTTSKRTLIKTYSPAK